jgi:hypothetical protein
VSKENDNVCEISGLTSINLLYRGDGIGQVRAPADLLDGIAGSGNTAAPERAGIPPEETPIGVNQTLLSEATFFHITSQSRNEMDKEVAFAEFEQGIRLPNEHGLNHLRISADAGVAIAEFHYHVRLDELLGDL